MVVSVRPVLFTTDKSHTQPVAVRAAFPLFKEKKRIRAGKFLAMHEKTNTHDIWDHINIRNITHYLIPFT